MAHYLFNLVKGNAAKGPELREQAAAFLEVMMWGIDADEPHRNALAPGDLILIYLGAPEREFIGHAELASTVHEKADFQAGVVRITVNKYETALAVAAGHPRVAESGRR